MELQQLENILFYILWRQGKISLHGGLLVSRCDGRQMTGLRGMVWGMISYKMDAMGVRRRMNPVGDDDALFWFVTELNRV